MHEHTNPLRQNGKRHGNRHVAQKETGLKPVTNKSSLLEMKRFKPNLAKSRRSSEAHSIAIFNKKLKDFGLNHDQGDAELEQKTFDVGMRALPVLPHLHIVAYAVTSVLVLVATSFAAYEASRSVVSKQFTTISNSACRSTVHTLQATLDKQIFLAKQLAQGLGRREGLHSVTTSNFENLAVGRELLFKESAEIYGATMVYFASANESFIGFDIKSNYVGVKDTANTNGAYVKYNPRTDGSNLRNTSEVIFRSADFRPSKRSWFIGAQQEYLKYKNQNDKRTKVVPYVSDVYLDFGSVDNFLIAVALPVIDAFTDNFIGVLAIDIELKTLFAGLSKAKQQAFPFDNTNSVIMAIVTKARDGNHMLLSVTDDSISKELDIRDLSDRSLAEAYKYDNLSEKGKDFLAILNDAVKVSANKELKFSTHTVSRGFMENKDSMGLDRWTVYIATTETAVHSFAYDASTVGIIVGSIIFVGLVAFSFYVRAHIQGANELLYATEMRIVDYLQQKLQQYLADTDEVPGSSPRKRAPDSHHFIESSIYRSDVRELNSYFVIFTPSLLSKSFVMLILLIAMANTAYWFSAGETIINAQVNTLVYDLSVEIQTKVVAYLHIPVGFVKVMAMFYSKGMLPSGLLNAGLERDRADAGTIGMMLEYPKYYAPNFCYIGTEENSFIGAELVPEKTPFHAEFMVKDNTTGSDSCNGVPLLVNYDPMNIASNYLVRNSSAPVKGKQFTNYHPINRPWYTAAKAIAPNAVWSEIYEFVGVVPPAFGITASIGFNHSLKKNNFYGVAAADFTLSQLHELLSTSLNFVLKDLEDGVGTAYLIEPNGNLVAMSSDTPATRTYKENGPVHRIPALELCNNANAGDLTCDNVVSASFSEIVDRVESGFFEKGLLSKEYPKGMEIEIGRGGEEGIMLMRLANIKVTGGLEWVLFSGFGKRTFLATFDRLKDLYLITSLGLTLSLILAGFLATRYYLGRLFHESLKEKSGFIVDDDVDRKQKIKTTLDPDSEAFFNEFRRLLAPTVLSANLVMRMLGSEARPPKVYETFCKLLMDKKNQAKHIFKQLDLNGDGKISRQEFVNGLHYLGYQPTQAECALLFAALDKDGDGYVTYDELIGQQDIVLVEPEATLAEKQRALEYLLISQNVECNVLDFLYFQRDFDVARIHGYRIFYSRAYGAFVNFGIILNLSLSFFEAPASRTEYNTVSEENENRLLTLSLLTGISILLYAIDLVFEVWLFGIHEPDRTLKEARRVSAKERRGNFDRVNNRNVSHQGNINKLLVGKVLILTLSIIDLMIPYYTGISNGDAPDRQLVFLLPYSALLRPLWPMLRFSGIRVTLIAFVKTIYHARAVFLMFFITLCIFSIIGTTLLSNRYPYDGYDSFQSIYKSFSTLFVYMVSAENYPDVVYPPTTCPNASIANTLDGGVVTAECNDTFIHFYTFFTSLWGTFLIVSLIIAAFEDGFSSFMAQNRVEQTIKSRMAIIAAFIILDKDNGGSLDKVEFLKFFNLTCNTGRMFNVDEDFELSGADFIQLCEELLHEMKMEDMKELQELEFGADRKNFQTCTPQVLFQFLHELHIDHLPEEGTQLSELNPKDNDIIKYWRYRGADYFQEHTRNLRHQQGGSKAGSESDRRKEQLRAFYKRASLFYANENYLTIIMCLLLLNTGLCCLYGASSKENIVFVDALNSLFVIFWSVELFVKVLVVGYDRYVHVNDDFFKEVQNRVDGAISLFAFLSLVVLATYRLLVIETGYVFEPWNDCTSSESCKVNDWARVILALNTLRLFGQFEIVRKIVFCFYIIIPNYFAIIQMTILLVYSYAVWGCMAFGGTFKYLHNYDMPQANFNSMTDSIITLAQLYIGEAWNGVMVAAVESVGSTAYAFFFSYVVITTMLLTNMLVGVIINGYGETVAVQKHAEAKNLSKVPSLLIVRALKEGKISEPRLDFTYGKDNEVRMDHNTSVLEKIAEAKAQLKEKHRLKIAVKNIIMTKKKRRERDEGRLSKFQHLIDASRDQFGFYTLKSRELLARYAMIILEEEDDQRRGRIETKVEAQPPRHSSMLSVNLKDLGLEKI